MVAYVPPKQAGKYKAVASGAITNGKAVVVNADGTVKQAASSVTVSAGLGSAVTFESASARPRMGTFDSNSNKVVVTYSDEGNSSYGTAVIGTIDDSDNSISFGTPVVFSSATTYYLTATFDSNAGKTGIFWADYGDSTKGKACVATISGTSVSYGTTVTFNSNSAGVPIKDSTYDTSENKILVL